MTPPNQSFPIHLPSDLTEQELQDFPAYKTWRSTILSSLDSQYSNPKHPFHSAPYTLRSLTVTSVDRFGKGRLGFIKINADLSNDHGEHLPGIALLRGASVGMLVILTPEGTDDEYALLTVQPRGPAGSMSFVELPAGMLDDAGSFGGAAAEEIDEECGISVNESELKDMTALIGTLATQSQYEAHLPQAVFTSPGGQDEYVPLFLYRKTVSQAELDSFRGKLTGERGSQEKITLKVVPLGDALIEAYRDAKAVCALTFYRTLKEGSML